jgi:hypothetical protein
VTKRKTILSVAGVIAGLAMAPHTVKATWPANPLAIRTISSQWCTSATAGSVHSYTCPFVSDYADYWGGVSGGVYADFEQTHYSGWVSGSACRQSWTGTAAACGVPSSSTVSGYIDMWISGFDTITGTPSMYDYFYVSLQSWSDAIDFVWGVGYTG